MELTAGAAAPAPAGAEQRRATGEAALRVRGTTGFVAIAAAVLTVYVLRTYSMVPGNVTIPWWGLAIAYFLSGVFVAHISIRNQAYTLTLSEVPMVLGLVAATPWALIAGGLAGTATSLILFRRQRPLKVVFNVALFLLEADVAIIVMHAVLNGYDVNSGIGWLATVAGAVAASVLAQVMVLIIIVVAGGTFPIGQVARTLGFMLLAAVLNTILALCGLHAAGRDPQVAALLLIPFVVLALAYRSYLSERHRHGQVRRLYEASGAMHRSRGVDASITTLLGQAREMFNAEVAELNVIPPDDPGAPRRFTLGPGDTPIAESIEDSGAIAELVIRGKPVRLALDGPASLLATRGWRNGIATSVSAEGGVNGVLVVANRRDAVSSFHRSDLELLGAFAGPVAVSLENGRLVAELEHQAFHDPLTGLANRALLSQRIEDALTNGPRGGFTILLLDVDDFKSVNDTLGHPAGDQLLVAISERLSWCLGPGDTAARLGGDEFAVILQSTADLDGAVAVAERILQTLRQPFKLSAWDVRVRASIGIVIDNPSVASVDDLLSRADIAMYRAKAQGKDRCVAFEPLMHVEVMARHQLRVDLNRAITERQLLIHYQPVVQLDTGEVTGAEALVRWAHPVRGIIPPDDFIALAEESGLIIAMGRYVLGEACRQLSAWQHDLPALHLSVNVSARELQGPTMVNDVLAACTRYEIDPSRLTLEVTEHAVVDDEATLDSLRQLRALGTLIALDDFGTGYSSLSCLRELPIDTVKIAKPFVDRLARGADDRALVTSVVGLARSLRLETVAEGIERPDQADVLRDAGCGRGQGFLFSRALPPAEFIGRVNSQRSGGSVLSLAG